MEVPTINTIGDLLASEMLKENHDFTKLLVKLPLVNTATISNAIRFCIANEKLEFAELMKFFSDKNFGVDGKSPCEYALQNGQFSMIKEMIKYGFDVNSLGFYESSSVGKQQVPIIIFAMIATATSKAFKFVLSLKPNLDIRCGDDKETPLMIAVKIGSYVELLLEAGANVLVTNRKGQYAAEYCLVKLNGQILK